MSEEKYSLDDKFSIRDLIKIIFSQDTESIVKMLIAENLYEYKKSVIESVPQIDYERIENKIKSEVTTYITKNVIPLMNNLIEQQRQTQELLIILPIEYPKIKRKKWFSWQ